MRTRYHILAPMLIGACQAPPVGHTGFGSMPDVTTAPAMSTGSSTSGSGSSGTSTGEDSSSGGGSAGSTSEQVRDLGGMPDFLGNDSPAGCKGKIDFLFVISRAGWMELSQAQLAAAFPQFIATIQSKFADFDYHIMVVDGDGGDSGWGNFICNDVCPNLACKVGEPCCSWSDPGWKGTPCCAAPDYPCQDLNLLTACDWAWGAGTVFPAGIDGEVNKPCPIDGDLRYLVKGQSNLEQTFACIATVGASGWDRLGQALTAAVQSNINDPGGCNNGFLRKDALLMVTFIANTVDEEGESEGTPHKWAQAVLDAKYGDDRSVVMLSIGPHKAEFELEDRIKMLVGLFPYHHIESSQVADYGPAFTTAANLTATACAGYSPPD